MFDIGTFFWALRLHIGDRQGYVFITRSGKPVMLNQLAVTFVKAGRAAGIPFKISPHVLRASAITYLGSSCFPIIIRLVWHPEFEKGPIHR